MTPLQRKRRKHLVLVGLPGSGKSTVGALVAETLKMPFIDVDGEIERATDLSVAAIFREHGEAHFRALESEAVRDLLNRPNPSVVAPGGGWAAHAGNLRIHAHQRICIYLETSPEIAVARASQVGERPLLPEGRELLAMEQLLRNREPHYASADLRVKTDNLTPSEVAYEVAELARMNGAL